MALPSFSIDGSLFDIPGWVVGGELSQVAVEESTVVFTPNFRYATEPVIWEATMDWVRQVRATVAPDGTLLPIAPDGTVGTGPVLLLANDPGLNITGLQWNCKVSLRSGDGGVSFWFNAPTNGSAVYLSDIAPSPGVSAVGTGSVPPQAGHAGEFLTTDGTLLGWTEAVGGAGGATNLGVARTATTVTVESSTGVDTTIPAADATGAGVMTTAMQSKLAAIEPSADVTDTTNVAAAGAVMATSKNVANGVAGLNSSGQVGAAQLPSTDAVTEGPTNLYYTNARADARVAAGITGKLDTTAAPELIRDTMGTGLVAGTNITITPSDVGDTITIATTGGSSLTDDGTGGYILGTGGGMTLTDDGTGGYILT